MMYPSAVPLSDGYASLSRTRASPRERNRRDVGLWPALSHGLVTRCHSGAVMTPKAVLFDLDETLIRRAIRRFVADQFARFSALLAPVTAEKYTSRFLEIEDDGRVAKTIIYPALVQELGITGISAAALLTDYRTEYARFTTASPGALDTVRALRDHGLKTGVITNGSGELQNAKIAAIGIRSLLDCVLVSESVGLKKPDPAIFHRAAS